MAPGGTTSNDNVFGIEDDSMEEGFTGEELKVQVNNFIWGHAPPDMTLGQADAIACRWFEQLNEQWERYRDRAKQTEQEPVPGPPNPPRPAHPNEVA